MRLQRIFLTLVLCSFALPAFSQSDKVYNFLNLGVDARSSALANSFVSVPNDVNSIFYNPAGLTTIATSQASVGFFKYLLDINSGNAAYGQKYKDIGFVGAGIRYVNYGNFKKFDEQSNEIGTFGASDLALSLGFAKNINEKISYGVNVKFIYSNIDEFSSSAIAADLGMLYNAPLDKLSAGISLLNLGTQISKYASTSEDLPLNLTLGASKALDYLPLTLSVAFGNLTQKEDKFFDRFKNFTIGGEFVLNDYVNLRLGYNNQQRQDLKTGSGLGLAGFSAGLGVKVNKYRLDYAFNSMGNIGATHRVNLNFSLY
jgi:long-subunit fatty acid transport protein